MSKATNDSRSNSDNLKLLGDFTVNLPLFSDLNHFFKRFYTNEFRSLSDKAKRSEIHQALCSLIEKENQPCFLLGAVVDFVDKINKEKIVNNYSFTQFELWLNQFSNLTNEENLHIRGKIVGKWVPRDAYQTLFPIGMGKMYPGSHYVTAHASPDLDTTVASFWGWVDAFGARVSHGLHLWNVPGGPPSSQVEIQFLFDHPIGDATFEVLTKKRTALTLSSVDLMTQKGFLKKRVNESTYSIDHERNQNAVVVIDDHGRFLGDWRNIDVEGVKQVVMQLGNCLRWFESYFHINLTSLFAKVELSRLDLEEFSLKFFSQPFKVCSFVKDLTKKQQKHLNDFLSKILLVPKGLDATFEEFSLGLESLGVAHLQYFIQEIKIAASSKIFNTDGSIVENRSEIFSCLEKILRALETGIEKVKEYVDTLGIALNIKREVLGYTPKVVSYRADVEEVKTTMGSYSYLTVTASDHEGGQIPLGVIHAGDLQKPILGTVSLRDFCNREETKIPPYFEVISVIDHHKTALNTSSTPMAFISDQQSSNALIAEKSFEINDQFGLNGRSLDDINKEVSEIVKDQKNHSDRRLLQRLLQKQIVSDIQKDYFIDPKREFLEYLHFLYAILDDTDLLSKVSYRDLDCIASLLNRMKTIASGKESEIIVFDDLARDDTYISRAAKRILQNADMYSLYRKIYHLKEENVEHNFRICVKGEASSVFADTKEQNGCCRVGQTKMFAKNHPTYLTYSNQIRGLWYADASKFFSERSEFDLHIHMVSTIPGAEDVYAGTEGSYEHKDELWLWIPSTDLATEHLKSFLSSFKQQPAIANNDIEVEFLGDNAAMLDQIFNESFFPVPRRETAKYEGIRLPIAILRYNAGTLNSRKAMISPYLPKIL